MIKDINIDGKIVKVEIILPDKIKEFLQKNNLDDKKILNDYKWEQCICEDLLDKNLEIRKDFEKAILVINYIHITQDNQIRIPSEDFAKGKKICDGNWSKGTFFDKLSMGYSIFIQ